jgi:Zn-dependent M28 family amino/carboxypeptidase
VVFGGHFDHLGVRNGAVYGGADDDASGTAAVMELARAFAKGPRLKRTLVFAAFDGEEAGLLGSYYYAAHPYGKTGVELNMDMISRNDTPLTPEEAAQRPARDNSSEMFLIGAFYSPELRSILERNAKEVGLEVNYRYDREPTQNVLWRGDSFPFVLDRVPAVWLFSGFTPDYHTPNDTVDKINVPKMEKTARLLYLTAIEIGNAPAVPAFLH